MKKMIFLLVVVFTATLVSAQTQSLQDAIKALDSARETELARVDDARNEGNISSRVWKKETKKINDKYDRWISQALKGESKPETSLNSGNRKTTGTNIQIDEYGTSSFSGRTRNIIRGSNAYSVVKEADAEAVLAEAYADYIRALSNGKNDLEIKLIISNEFKYRNASISIVGADAVNSKIKKEFFLKGEQRVTTTLPPGNYTYTAKADGYERSKPKIINLDPLKKSNFNGEDCGKFIVIGE